MQQLIDFMGVIIATAIFWGLIILYLGADRVGLRSREHVDRPSDMSSSDKLRMSKADGFFDGESEDYAEHMSRLRQYGGA